MRISYWSSDVCSSDLSESYQESCSIYREFIGLSALNALGLDETTASFFPLTFPLLFALRLTLRLEVWYEPAEVDIGSVESLGQGFVAARRREHKIPMRSVVGIAISENEREAAIGDRKSDGLISIASGWQLFRLQANFICLLSTSIWSRASVIV